jgi:hypothetical protein
MSMLLTELTVKNSQIIELVQRRYFVKAGMKIDNE